MLQPRVVVRRPVLSGNFGRLLRIVVAVSLVLSGCAPPLRVERLSPQASYGRLNQSALSGDRPRETTLTVLRRHGLLETWDKDPPAAIAGLRREVVGRSALWPELFALAELSYLRGRKDGSQPDSLAAAIYAYAFLFPRSLLDQSGSMAAGAAGVPCAAASCSSRMRRTSAIVAGLDWVEWPERTTSSESTPSMWALE